MYSITPAGRRALSAWLATDPAPPSLEFEGLIRVLFADQGTLDDLTHTLHRVREQAHQQLDRFHEHARLITDTGGTFPERAHLFELTTAFMLGHFTHLAQWATQTLKQIETWQDTTTQPPNPNPHATNSPS